MQFSQIPGRIALPFAYSGAKNTIPVASQIGITPGAASYTDGFPPLTRTPKVAGGIAPFGQDMNGVLNAITAVQQWQSAGGSFVYDLAFSTSIGGYPKGAILISADGSTEWLCLADSNTTDPDGGSSTNWAALAAYGIGAVTGLTNANVTLTPAQYSKETITLAGTLTGNVQIIFPTTLQHWRVLNNTTGAFTVTCKTASGTGGAVTQGSQDTFYGDGTNLVPSSTILFPATLAANGSIGIPGGFLMQWGSASAIPVSGAPVPFNVAFPTACYAVFPVIKNGGADPATPVWVNGVPTQTSFGCDHGNAASLDIFWFAVGK